MDDEVAAGEDFVSLGGFPLPSAVRNYTLKSSQRRHSHIVYKRSDNPETQFNDYGMYSCIILTYDLINFF